MGDRFVERSDHIHCMAIGNRIAGWTNRIYRGGEATPGPAVVGSHRTVGLGRHGIRGNHDSEHSARQVLSNFEDARSMTTISETTTMNENHPVLQVENLSKTFGSRTLWKGLNLQAYRGEMIALRGPSGCGKSTLLSTIGLLVRPDSGHIMIDGTDILAIPRRQHKRVRRETIGNLFQDYALLENATVRENLDIAARPRPLLPKPSFASALERVGLPGQERTPVHTLSGGEQQRVALARLLLKPSRITLANEPTASLDRDNENLVLDLLQDLANEGKVILLATHSDRVAGRCSRVLSLHHH